MVRECNIRVGGVIEVGKLAKFKRVVTSTFRVTKKNLVEKWGFEENIKVL
jgi:hypothetical protein